MFISDPSSRKYDFSKNNTIMWGWFNPLSILTSWVNASRSSSVSFFFETIFTATSLPVFLKFCRYTNFYIIIFGTFSIAFLTIENAPDPSSSPREYDWANLRTIHRKAITKVSIIMISRIAFWYFISPKTDSFTDSWLSKNG